MNHKRVYDSYYLIRGSSSKGYDRSFWLHLSLLGGPEGGGGGRPRSFRIRKAQRAFSKFNEPPAPSPLHAVP